MGLRMDDLHAPTVGSGPTSQAASNSQGSKKSFQELITQKQNLEAELSALGSVLDSVSKLVRNRTAEADKKLAWREYDDSAYHA